jgi:DNA-binding FrmR family transcriptional regulator
VSHTKREKMKLLNRVRRVRGQVEAIERALEDEQSCATILHQIDHIRLHVVDPTKDAERSRGADELIEAVQAYLK